MLQDTAGAGKPVLWHVRTTGAILVTVKAVWSSAIVGGTETQEKSLLRRRGDWWPRAYRATGTTGTTGPWGQDCHEGRLRHEGAQVMTGTEAEAVGVAKSFWHTQQIFWAHR